VVRHRGHGARLARGRGRAARLAGIAGLSGYLPLADATAAERADANRDTPIFLAHGVDDPVVSLARGRASRDRLQALGCTLDWHEYPIEHTVSLDEIRDLQCWLLARFAP